MAPGPSAVIWRVIVASNVSLNLSNRFRAAFEEASKTTGTKFDYLVSTAQRESGLNASAKAPSSSATGLFQFVEQTWLETMKEQGPALGFGQAASRISKSGDKYYVHDAATRQKILDMRKDPETAAMLAGAYAQKNKALLSQNLDRQPTSGELYAAHFLGAQGSSKLIELAENKPDTAAYKIFPQQAQANRNIFFDRQGNPKTVSQVYDNLVATVPSKPKERTFIGMLGNWFKHKDNGSEPFTDKSSAASQVAVNKFVSSERVNDATNKAAVVSDSASSLETFFNQPAQRELPSRYGLSYNSDPSVAGSLRSSRFAPSATADQLRRSRVYTEAAQTALAETEAAPLPRGKPEDAGVSRNGAVDDLNGALPRAKPHGTSGGSSIGSSNGDGGRPQQRFGALDLTAFLDRDVFSASKKA